MIRRRLPAPDPVTGATLTDVVGELVERTDTTIRVVSRSGAVDVPRADVVLAKVVPPRPSRRGAPHLALSVDDLQRVMLGAWGAVEREWLGAWQLRASGGYTYRGNSVATPGSPGLPLAEAVARARSWYAARGLPLNVTVAGPLGFDPLQDPLGALMVGGGAAVSPVTLTLTAAAEGVSAAPSPPLEVTLGPVPTPPWLAAYGAYRAVVPATVAVLTGSPEQVFASVSDAGRVIGVGRLGLSDGWGGIAALHVDPEHRRRGIATAISAALAGAARSRGARSLHLQVVADNEAARALYERMGFTVHHSYVNLVEPD